MTTEQEAKCREAFERKYGDPDNPRALERSGDSYRLMQFHLAWRAWQAAWSAAQAGRWLPMETAPKDGTEVLLISKPTAALPADYAVAYYENGEWFYKKPYRFLWPTGWMPLPTPPTQPSARGAENATGAQETGAVRNGTFSHTCVYVGPYCVFGCAPKVKPDDVKTYTEATQPSSGEACKYCRGTGADPLSDNLNWRPCSSCGGKPITGPEWGEG